MKTLTLLVVAPLAVLSAQSPDLSARIAAHKPPLVPGDPELVIYFSGSYRLLGYVYKPVGSGPFPAIIWNHGSERVPGSQPELAQFYTNHGFVFFIPHRHGHGKSSGEYISDVFAAYTRTHPNPIDQNREAVRLHELYNNDVISAASWLKFQPYVSPQKIVMSGVSYGGIQTLLSAEKVTGVKGYIAFAPGAMSWANGELRKRLQQSVKDARAPLFLVQAKNDYSTGPVELLGPQILKRGAPNQAKLYPAFGTTHDQGHYAFATWDIGTEVWGADVLSFISNVLK